MHRSKLAVLSALLGVVLLACGEDPEAPAGGPRVAPDDSIELRFRVDAGDASDAGAVERAVGILDQRFRALDLDGSFEVSGSHISVTVPEESASLVRTTMLTPGHMELRPVLTPIGPIGDDGEVELTSPEELSAEGEAVLATQDGLAYRLGPVVLDGAAFEQATAARPEQGMWVVDLLLHEGERGIDAFNAIAARCHAGEPTCPAAAGDSGQLAIVLDGVILSAPTINMPAFERDQIRLSGDFDEASARALAVALRVGSSVVGVVEAD